ncbi:MAG: hypothetical protein HYZ57_15995 [Acidobacteria bacterium]|nr:hypothetical protein [Acidobacteriota bacterium]
MEETHNSSPAAQENAPADIRSVIQDAIREFITAEQSKKEPAYKQELTEERKRREQLERRLNELVEENRRSRQAAEEAERTSAVRAELQRLGVSKIDLAYRAIKEDVRRTEDGSIVARGSSGDVPLREYLAQFVNENPELLPARIPGGSGIATVQPATPASPIDIDRIKPGMSPEELERVRQEIARIASQSIRGNN